VGADFFELDVRTTSDGQRVLSHDATVDRNYERARRSLGDDLRRDSRGRCGIKMGPEFTGTRAPTFDEALDLARGKIDSYVDVKNASAKDRANHIVVWDDRPRGDLFGRISKGSARERRNSQLAELGVFAFPESDFRRPRRSMQRASRRPVNIGNESLGLLRPVSPSAPTRKPNKTGVLQFLSEPLFHPAPK
jgi:hypothetical protein